MALRRHTHALGLWHATVRALKIGFQNKNMLFAKPRLMFRQNVIQMR
ncbi:hypothetical protein SAMN02746062_01058 [Alysiella filiformis DSM 16848]|uniref:Uncharacterized protein n=1 Tax=Alysiella filiformis DSM 16848 TaxID=1120981 RepID=A0A286EAI4_9NEIS|nr:hypothetical protein SAMN02746062_01058 [Alysiella filiformis DSM 16848]